MPFKKSIHTREVPFSGCVVLILTSLYYSYIQDAYKEYMEYIDPETEVFLLALFRDTASSLVVTPLDSFLTIDRADTERFHDG